MKRRVLTQALLMGLVARGAPAFAANPLPALQETRGLLDKVKSGALPPVDKRLPKQPRVIESFSGADGIGRQGGQLNMLVAATRDTRLMTVYSYTRLIVYDDKFKLHPDILESYEVKEGREFTFKLRAGHKWSDGHPFTTEDFRFFWEDIANNKDLSPNGPSVELLVEGKPPRVEILDEVTIRYSWDKPNPDFIESQARAAPLFLFRPAHYLKTLHGKYADEEEILKRHKGSRWANVFKRQDAMYGNSNVDLPTLNPWVLMTVVASNLIPAKAGLGESDLQPRYLGLRDFTFLRDAAKTSGIKALLWEKGSGSEVAFYPNMNANDETWRKLNRDVRFRRALSLAIDRHELSEVVYSGLAKPSANTIMPRSPLFKPEYATKWATYDVKAANKLLDEIGLTKKGSDGIRLLPNGQPAMFVIEHSSEKADEVDNMTLVIDQWKKIGIKALLKPQTTDNFRLRTTSGEAIMTAYAGVTTAAPTVDTSPREFTPVMQGGLQWPKWGLYVESKGKQGEPCDMEVGKKLLELLARWEKAVDAAEKRKAWEDILSVNADEVFSIGTVNEVRQPVTVGKKVRNVPDKGYWAWDPGGYIGLYEPDTFWIAS